MKELLMPKLGAAMEIGMITEWLVAVGDEVKKGDDICEITTEKITNTIPSVWDGVVEKLLFEEEDEVKCGEVIALIREA